MSNPDAVSYYEIWLKGHLDERWRSSFVGLTFTHRIDDDGTPLTILSGEVLDEAELHGVLARIRDLGIPLLQVRRRPQMDLADFTQDTSRRGEQ